MVGKFYVIECKNESQNIWAFLLILSLTIRLLTSHFQQHYLTENVCVWQGSGGVGLNDCQRPNGYSVSPANELCTKVTHF